MSGGQVWFLMVVRYLFHRVSSIFTRYVEFLEISAARLILPLAQFPTYSYSHSIAQQQQGGKIPAAADGKLVRSLWRLVQTHL